MSYLFGYGYGRYGGFVDNSQSEHLTSPLLGDIDPNQIFDGTFTMGLSSDQHLYLVQAFLDCYSHRQICHESVFTWKRLVRGRYISIRDRYDRLFKTLDLIDDPLLTFREEETEDNRKQETGKEYGTETRRNDSNAINQEGSTAKDKSESYGDSQGFNHDRALTHDVSKSEAKSSVGRDVSVTDYDLFTDTPQTGQPSSISNGNEGGNTPVFNEGYLTEGRKKTHAERETEGNISGNSTANSNDSERQGRTGENTYNYSQNTANNSSLVHNTGQEMMKGNQTRSKGGAENEQRLRKRFGFEDESISSLLTQYRETCITITGDFLEEFSDLFVTVY